MGPWRSDFELLIPDCTPGRFADLAVTRGCRRTTAGLIVRVREGRIRARYNELSRQSVAPLLKGRLVQEDAGTRIVGQIQWTNVVVAPIVTGAVGVAALAGSASLIATGEWIAGVCSIVVGAAFGFLAVKNFRGECAERTFEEGRLRRELLDMFAKHRRQHAP